MENGEKAKIAVNPEYLVVKTTWGKVFSGILALGGLVFAGIFWAGPAIANNHNDERYVQRTKYESDRGDLKDVLSEVKSDVKEVKNDIKELLKNYTP